MQSDSSLNPTSTPTEAELSTATPTELLLLASRLGRTDLAVSALRSGAPVNPPGTTPLHHSLSLGHVDVTRALLAAGARLSSRDASRQTPIDLAQHSPPLRHTLATHVCQRAAAGDVAAVRDAADAGWDLCAPDIPELGNTPLHWAASFGQRHVVGLLIDSGVPPDVVNAKGETPLMDAAKGGFVNVVRLLMAKGADTALTNKEGQTAASLARGDEVLGVLLRGSDVVPEAAHQPVEEPTTPYFVPGERIGRVEDPGWGGLLWPKVRRFVEVPGGFNVPPEIVVSVEGRCIGVGRSFVAWLAELFGDDYVVRLVGGGGGGLGEPIAFKATFFVRWDEYGVEGGDEAYRLTVRDYGVDIVGGGLPGVFYGCSTFVNVLRLRMEQSAHGFAPLVLPTFSITDWPTVRRRGLYLDVSGRRLPSLDTLKRIVSFMAKDMKMNQLQLNVGDNFEWLEGLKRKTSLRHENFLALEEICRNNFVELIPVIGSKQVPETTLDNLHINSNSEDFVGEAPKEVLGRELMYDEFLPLFRSEQVNLGELSHRAKCDFSDFEQLRSAVKSVRSRGKRTTHVFAEKLVEAIHDAVSKPGLLAELPTRCIMLLELKDGKEGKFRNNCRTMRQYGLSFYSCTSSCLEGSLAGRTSASRDLSCTIVDVAVEQGAAGVLLRDTSGISEGAPLVFLFQSLVVFAGAAWNSKEIVKDGSLVPDDVLSKLFDMYIFRDPVAKGMLGHISVSLGDLHQTAGDRSGTALYNILARPSSDLQTAVNSMTYLGLRKATKRADKIENALSSYRGNADATDVQELRMAAIFLGVAARIGAYLYSISSATSMDSNKAIPETGFGIESLPDGRRSDLCNALLQGIELMRTAWLARYHEDGFTDTVQIISGETLSQLSRGMPYERFLEDRKASGWVPSDDSRP